MKFGFKHKTPRSRTAKVFAALRRPAVLVAAPIAYLAGIATMLPFGLSLDPNSATVIAATVTSALAVGGALAVWHYQQDQEAAAVGLFLAELLSSPKFDLSHLAKQAARIEGLTSWDQLRFWMNEAQHKITNVGAYYNRNNPVILKLDQQAISMLAFYFPSILKELNVQLQAARLQSCQNATRENGGALANAGELIFACKQYVQFCEELSEMVGFKDE
jgi:hypothetical protein